MRRAWLTAVVCCVHWALPAGAAPPAVPPISRLIPYPQEIKTSAGALTLGPARLVTEGPPSTTEQLALKTLERYLPRQGTTVPVRLGSVEEGFSPAWLSLEHRRFLENPATSLEASVLVVSADAITVVGKGKQGMLFGVQTVNQMIRGTETVQGLWALNTSLPCQTIRDWPDMPWRCLSPQMTWYSGYNRLEGYDNGNWTLDEWKRLVDWSLLHKCNAWALCLYGNWPFRLPGYEETTLDVTSSFFNPETGRKEPHRFIHRNIRTEFLPELIRYANQRGVKIFAYIGKNSFNGTYGLKHPDANAGGAAELIPFHPGVHAYWDAFIRRLVELGFNGFVFEDPEALHVPNQNAGCYRTFWEPWARTYGFKSVADTDQNNPPLGVHIEYYAWLFRTFDAMIRKHEAEFGRPQDIYLISHVLLARVVSESKTKEDCERWFALMDEKQGRKMPFIIMESDEQKYVNFFGRDRVASLGGRGGSCTNAMRRIASINNNWCGGGMAGDLAYERQCQKRIAEAGGFGAMGYVFEWTNTEVFGYLASQYLWRNAGVPGIDNNNQTGFLDYSYRAHYGDRVGAVVARVMDEGSCVNDAMMLDGVYGSQYPSTGAPLDRDYQYLAVQADRAVELSRSAFRLYTGNDPAVDHPVYRQDDFRWDGFDPVADRTFKSERLRLLHVSTRRSQAMCESVLAHRKAQRLIAAGAPVGQVLDAFARAIKAAEANQLFYQLNYDDDYEATDGLCSRVTDAMKSQRDLFIASVDPDTKPLQAWTFDRPGDVEGWAETHDMATPTAAGGSLVSRATGADPFVVQSLPLSVPVDGRCFVELTMASDRPGRLRVFWATRDAQAALSGGSTPFSEARVRNVDVVTGSEPRIYRVALEAQGLLSRLRVDIPKDARVSIDAIRVLRVAEGASLSRDALAKPVPGPVRRSALAPRFIAWEKQADIVPERDPVVQPGLFLSVDVGCDTRPDFYRLGVVFTMELLMDDGTWRPLFRRSVPRRMTGWDHWDLPLPGMTMESKPLRIRLVTDSYSRAQDRSAPSWTWALWGAPRIVEVTADGQSHVRYDFLQNIDRARLFVRLDSDGRERAFDHNAADSTGATFKAVGPGVVRGLMSGEGAAWQWVDGFTGWAKPPPQRGSYRSYLGSVDSGWIYSRQNGEVSWFTGPARERKPTAVAFIGGTGYGRGKADLWCNGKKLLTFETARPEDARWAEGGAELRYHHGGDTRNETTTFGISGVYELRLASSLVTPGKPLNLAVRLPSDGGGDWFMVHEYRDTAAATDDASPPDPRTPAIAAFTPHLDGTFGVTIAEFPVELAR